MNIPNMLSVFRLCLIPIFTLLYFSGFAYAKLYSALIYALATFTDFLDGYIARKYNLITNLGRVLDPLGDKLFTLAVLSCLAFDGIIPWWMVLLFFTKEVIMGLGGLVIHKKGHMDIPSSNIIGKTATVLFFFVCVILLVADVPRNAVKPMVGAALAVSLVAFCSYLIKFYSLMKQRPN